MASIFDHYGTDTTAENDGAWIEMRGGSQFCIRAEDSERVREWALRRAKSQRNHIIAHGGVLPPKLADKNDIDMCAEVIVVNWRAVQDAAGAEIPYSVDAARALFEQLPALRRDVLFVARTEETYRKQAVEALGKTSATPSKPTSGSEETPRS